MAKLQADLREFIGLLSSHEVEYLVVGGHAVAFHEQVAFGNSEGAEAESEPGRIVQLGHPPNRIDILTSISGVDFDSAWEGRVHTTMDDQPVNLLGWDELLQNKQASGRQKDLADIEKLLAIAKTKRR